jgi:CRP/FNR family transcriptional regulator, cyclic AMP receptor protein
VIFGTVAGGHRATGHTEAVQDLLTLCADLPLRTWGPGEAIFEFGRVSDAMYVLRTGTVTIERDGVVFVRISTPGAIFGEMSVVLGRPSNAEALAASTVICHVIEDPEAFLTERPGAAMAVLRVTASRLDGITKYLVDVKRQFADKEGHLGMLGPIIDALEHHQGTARPGSARDPDG